MIVALALLLIAAVVITLLVSGGDPELGTGVPHTSAPPGPTNGPKPPPASATSGQATAQPSDQPPPQPTTSYVTVNREDYIGRDVDTVLPALQELGLQPEVFPAQDGTEGRPGMVVDIEPTGEVALGTVITVYAIQPGRGGNR